jgi:hypothetical protein
MTYKTKKQLLIGAGILSALFAAYLFMGGYGLLVISQVAIGLLLMAFVLRFIARFIRAVWRLGAPR